MSNPLLTAGQVRIVRVSGGNLYRIAAEYLGDASQWNRIARVNGLVDPWLVGSYVLTIPHRSTKAGNGGILE